jgi:hypothetical protein
MSPKAPLLLSSPKGPANPRFRSAQATKNLNAQQPANLETVPVPWPKG